MVQEAHGAQVLLDPDYRPKMCGLAVHWIQTDRQLDKYILDCYLKLQNGSKLNGSYLTVTTLSTIDFFPPGGHLALDTFVEHLSRT
jgi:hypothetical protein